MFNKTVLDIKKLVAVLSCTYGNEQKLSEDCTLTSKYIGLHTTRTTNLKLWSNKKRSLKVEDFSANQFSPVIKES